MESVGSELKREVNRQVVQWQLPIVIRSDRDIICFISVMEPRAKVPEHSHDHGALRIVMQGSLKYRDKELKPRDWMWVPAGVSYALEAGPEGCFVFYPHPIPWPWPW
jgi:quercetin dioxygenase-like cupin family protein